MRMFVFRGMFTLAHDSRYWRLLSENQVTHVRRRDNDWAKTCLAKVMSGKPPPAPVDPLQVAQQGQQTQAQGHPGVVDPNQPVPMDASGMQGGCAAVVGVRVASMWRLFTCVLLLCLTLVPFSCAAGVAGAPLGPGSTQLQGAPAQTQAGMADGYAPAVGQGQQAYGVPMQQQGQYAPVPQPMGTQNIK